MAVTIAGTTVPTPNRLNEFEVQIQHDNEAIDGSVQRSRIGSKKLADMAWDALRPADYQTILGLITTGAAVAYSNNQSNRAGGVFSFTGLPTFEEGEYIKGGTLFRSMNLQIREA